MLKRDLALNILKSSYFIILVFFSCVVLFCRFYVLTLLEILQKTMYRHKTTLIMCLWSFCWKPLELETPITQSNFNFPWQFELPGFTCMWLFTQKKPIQKKKLNLLVNKAILIQNLKHHLPTIPPPPINAFLRIMQILNIQHAVNQVHIYLFIFHSFSSLW